MHSWIEAPPNETPQAQLDRLVLHGLRCGKRTVVALAFHAGEHGYNVESQRRALAALHRLAAAGKADRVGAYGWRAT